MHDQVHLYMEPALSMSFIASAWDHFGPLICAGSDTDCSLHRRQNGLQLHNYVPCLGLVHYITSRLFLTWKGAQHLTYWLSYPCVYLNNGDPSTWELVPL